MDVRLVNAPSDGTMAIVNGRSGARWDRDFRPAALGLVQGRLIEMVVASDVAEKSAGVVVTDVRGSCPQNMVMLAIAGETAEVVECLRRIREEVDR